MNNYNIIILASLILSLFLYCSAEDQQIKIFSVDISADSFLSNGETKTITLSSNVSWSVSSNQDWLSISPERGTGDSRLKINAIENNTIEARSGVVTIRPQTGESIKINISQASNYQFYTNEKDVSFESDEGVVNLQLTSNTSWRVESNVDWVKVEPENGTGNAILKFTTIKNDATSDRSGMVTIIPEIGDPIKVSVLQEATSVQISDIVKYVAPNRVGKGTGNSEDNASDFLDDIFWAQVNSDLKNKSVEVKFLSGTYSRAFTEKSLSLRNIGNPDNRLLISGTENVRFTAPDGFPDKNQMIRIDGCQNLIISNFHFTGNGRIGYVLRIITTGTSTLPNKNIVIENCTWKHMGGIIYGATGCYGVNTSHVTFRNCEFVRIGIDGHSHHMYHAHGPSYIKIIDSHFEDCTGDYVRFRDKCEYGVVENCTFVRNQDYANRPFIAVPLFNSRAPVGDEYFATNYSFTNNKFHNRNSQRTTNAIYFGHWGFTPPEFMYLLTAEEGEVLTKGSSEERTILSKNNFGLEMSKIRIMNNTYSGVTNNVALISQASYGAVSLGWVGTANISDLPNNSNKKFDWEENM